jgi:hypothetical protein
MSCGAQHFSLITRRHRGCGVHGVGKSLFSDLRAFRASTLHIQKVLD